MDLVELRVATNIETLDAKLNKIYSSLACAQAEYNDYVVVAAAEGEKD